MEEWIAYRRNIQNAARRLFVARRVDPDFENKLLELMNKPETYRSKVFNEASEHNTKTMATMIAEVASTLSTKQKETLIENIDEFIETIENFQQ
jgi:peptide methionine sulfoxide reductase MsrA